MEVLEECLGSMIKNNLFIKESHMSMHSINVLLPLLFLLYQIMIDFVDLYPFNDIQSKDKRLRKYEVLGNYPPLLLIALCFYLESTISHVIGLALTAIIFIMHLFTWWFPYWFGFPVRVKDDYVRYFSKTYKFLPPIRDHIVPDAEHCGVGVLLLATLIFQVSFLYGHFH
jgi:hypothetical protein